jgi:hypothetical protein
MTAPLDCSPAHLAPLAHRDRERRATIARTTLWTALRGAALAALVACGGSSHGDTYAKGEQVQQKCCEHLAAGRDQCLAEIPRPPDRAVAQSSANQSTYACVVDHFACDASTGRPTRESAQAQLECIQDLQ